MGILSKGITKYYDIGKTIGKGSFATVKEGTRKDTGQKVAIKVIDKKDAVFDAESLEQEVTRINGKLTVLTKPWFADRNDEKSESSELRGIAWCI
mmetsp:Transcript_30298/g.80238  ORF Transcript_30298/g.80238 Transcript_30298/m.80238 type:complete len:95 (+) Transcript_30298:165-449(+)